MGQLDGQLAKVPEARSLSALLEKFLGLRKFL
jgi:hypothetical protein